MARTGNAAAIVRSKLTLGAMHLFLGFLLLLSLAPLFILLIDAGKTTYQFEAYPLQLTFPYHFEHYWAMLIGMRRYILNSSIVSAVSISLVILISSYTAYTFARFSFPGKEFLFYAIVMLMMIPFVLYLIPQYILVLRLGLMNSRWALIFPYTAGGTVLGVFLIRPFVASLPQELFEAARMDGANEWQEYVRIAFPLCTPILATLSIMLLLGQWNDLIWPAVTLSNHELFTVTLGIFSIASTIFAGGMAVSTGQTQWGHMFAAFVISALPLVLVFIVARKAFVKGLTSGALKF